MPGDAGAVFGPYHMLIDMPGGTWSEAYPGREIVEDGLLNLRIMCDARVAAIAPAAVSPCEPSYGIGANRRVRSRETAGLRAMRSSRR